MPRIMNRAMGDVDLYDHLHTGQRFLIRFPEHNPVLGAMTVNMLRVMLELTAEASECIHRALNRYPDESSDVGAIEVSIRFPEGYPAEFLKLKFTTLVLWNGLVAIPILDTRQDFPGS